MATDFLRPLRRALFAAILIAAWPAVESCSTPGQTGSEEATPADQTQVAVDRIRELVRIWASDLNRGNIASAVSIYAQEVIYMPPAQPPLQGPEQVRNYLEQLFPSGRSSFTYSSREIQASGDLAYERGVFVRAASETGSAGGSKNGNLLRIFRRSEDGAWKVTREIWNVSLDSGTEQQGTSARQ